jgi:hypothetical protein
MRKTGSASAEVGALPRNENSQNSLHILISSVYQYSTALRCLKNGTCGRGDQSAPPVSVRPNFMFWYKVPENVDKRVGRQDAVYVCRKTVPMLTARGPFLSLSSTNIASLFYLTTTFAALVRLVFIITLSESADRPHARRYMTNYSCQLK